MVYLCEHVSYHLQDTAEWHRQFLAGIKVCDYLYNTVILMNFDLPSVNQFSSFGLKTFIPHKVFLAMFCYLQILSHLM